MDTESWSRIRTIVEGALALAPGEREAFVDREAAGDAAVAGEARALLALEGRRADWLEPPRGAFELGAAGTRIGPWELVREIGAGGMGTVYLAERRGASFEQRAALKLLKRGMDTDELLERFRRERQVLAALEHPGIARLIDGGATEDGRPYLVMEHVDGRPIDEWCEERGPSTRERIDLFLEVCAAVDYAHRNLVVHRDLKPSNVLVTSSGAPKLLDFGIAKVLDPDRTDPTRDLTVEARVFTPDFASPEQVRGEAVTTASDVYSLGALLYQLLTGVRAHRFTTRTPVEIERVVCERDPARPSAAVASRALARELAGDLDTIVLKSMHKEPERRYASVDRLADDLRRHLTGHPVTARPDSALYRAGKFVRRNRVPVAAGVAVLAVLSAALWNSNRLQRRATAAWKEEQAQRALAQRRFDDVRALALQSVFEVAQQLSDLPGTAEVREQIVRTASERLDDLAAEAGDDDELWYDLGRAYLQLGEVQGGPHATSLGRPDLALASFAKAGEIAGRLDPDGPHAASALQLSARARSARAGTLSWQGEHAEALALYRACAADYEELARAGGSERVPLEVLRGIAEVLTVLGRYDEASEAFEAATAEARARWEEGGTAEDADALVVALLAEASKGIDLERHRRSEELLREALALLEEHDDGGLIALRRLTEANYTLGHLLVKARPGDPEGVERLEHAAGLAGDLIARDPRDLPTRQFLVKALFTLGERHIHAGEHERALELLRRAEAEYAEGPAPDIEERRRDLAVTRDLIGKALYRLGRHDESIAVLEEVRDYWRARVAAEPDSARARRDLAVNSYFLAYPVLERVPEDAPIPEVAAACEASRAYFQECLDLLLALDAEGLLLEPDRAQMEHVRANLDGLDDKLAGLEGAD